MFPQETQSRSGATLDPLDALAAGALGIALASVAVCYLTGHPIHDLLFNADALYLPTLFKDVLSEGGSFRDWRIPPAPYFFPDYPVFGVAFALGKDAFVQILLTMLLQVLLTVSATYLVASRVVPDQAFWASACAGVLMVWAAMEAGSPFDFMLIATFHYGAFLAGLLLLGLALRLPTLGPGDPGRGPIGAIALLAGCAGLSDDLFVFQAALPALVAACFVRTRIAHLPLRPLPWLVLPLGAAVAGSLAWKLVTRGEAVLFSFVRIERLGPRILDPLRHLADLAARCPALGAFYLCFGLVVALCVRAAIRGERWRGITTPLVWLISTWLVSSLTATIPILALTNLRIPPRYLIPAFLLPVLIGVFLVAELTGRGGKLALTCLCVGLAGSLAASASRRVGEGPLVGGFYPEPIACVDRLLSPLGLRRGIAQYWDAKYLQAFSRSGLVLTQYHRDLEQHYWITSRRYYLPGYDFALVREGSSDPLDLARAEIEARSGPPARVERCGPWTVMIYGPGKLVIEPGS